MIQDKEVKSFFEFLISNKAQTGYTSNLSKYVADAKHNTQWRLQYMTVERLERFAYKNGLEQGALQKAEEDAMNMLKKKYPVNDILEITGLTLEQVQELQKELAAQPVAAEA